MSSEMYEAYDSAFEDCLLYGCVTIETQTLWQLAWLKAYGKTCERCLHSPTAIAYKLWRNDEED